MNTVTVNALGKACPIPVVMTNKALAELAEPGTVKVLVDNETAVQNLSRLAASKNCPSSVEKTEDGNFAVLISVETLPVGGAEAAGCASEGPLVVSIGADHMGEGDPELGKALMKAFIFAVSQQEKLPDSMLFYNGGAKLTCEGSAALEDLKNMAEAGVEIMTCGTCLNFYGLSDKLAVGAVGNMYSIVEKLEAAGRVVKP
ncbi:MAG: sulfurtransferase-like selenium metabolism protein YedF [Firmicutes bacterium]|nr:sulfurtransferase-like selenium metabolism protein YedF [Bacillota bacterium]